MPFMHSESLAVHDWAAKWFDEPGPERRKKYELLHREIIGAPLDDTHTEIVCLEELQLLKKPYKNIQILNKRVLGLFLLPE